MGASKRVDGEQLKNAILAAAEKVLRQLLADPPDNKDEWATLIESAAKAALENFAGSVVQCEHETDMGQLVQWDQAAERIEVQVAPRGHSKLHQYSVNVMGHHHEHGPLAL